MSFSCNKRKYNSFQEKIEILGITSYFFIIISKCYNRPNLKNLVRIDCFDEDVGSVVEWLKRRARDQHGLGSKPTRTLGKTLYGTFPCLVVLASSSKLQSYLY